jgi:hypothetical protein
MALFGLGPLDRIPHDPRGAAAGNAAGCHCSEAEFLQISRPGCFQEFVMDQVSERTKGLAGRLPGGQAKGLQFLRTKGDQVKDLGQAVPVGIEGDRHATEIVFRLDQVETYPGKRLVLQKYLLSGGLHASRQRVGIHPPVTFPIKLA